MRVLAIDFGTSNTVAALLIEGQAPRTVTFDTSPLLPSAVYVDVDGQVTVGRDAQRSARLDPARFEPNPKRRIDDGEVLLGDRVVPVVEIIAAVLRAVAIEVRRQLGGGLPDEVRLTHPAQWGASRQNVLVSAARSAGLGANLLLIPEPVAAAAQFTQLPGRALPPGGTVAVYDLGGGTFDIAIVGRTQPSSGSSPGPARDGEFHVLAEAGLPDLGGLDFDQAILDQVGRDTSSADPARWQQILRPVDTSSRRAARALAEDVRAAKETLSRYPQTDVSLPDPFVDAHLTRTEFEGLIRPNLLRSIEVLTSVLQNAGIGPEKLNGIFLVGGSSRIPLVAGLIQDRLHVTPVALDQPETAVALGALLVPVRRDGNRTVALTDGQSPRSGAPAGPGLYGAGGMGRPGLQTGGQLPIGDPGRGSTNTSGRSSGTGNRRRLTVIAAAVAVVVVLVLVLVIVKPFGPSPTPGADPTTPVTASGAATSGSSPVKPQTSGAQSSGAQSSGVQPTGLGPGKLFTAGEVAFMGTSIAQLINCVDSTTAYNASVAAKLKVGRAVRCQAPAAALTPDLKGEQILVYVMTASAPSTGPIAYLDQLVKSRQKDTSELYKYDSDAPFTVGSVSGRVMTAFDLPALGGSGDRGASVLGWVLTGQPYIGVVVSVSTSTQDELMTYWAQSYKPRG
ncbi:Ethanolamine utilization protein EutJ (predicted chaperonin) [Nakamurella sp. UYEF19]|uniref:Hsp70 family protein n=1 Tax=Nakamurella sp. UYEF19 TaxID=1756392 RepID=UPI00339409B0